MVKEEPHISMIDSTQFRLNIVQSFKSLTHVFLFHFTPFFFLLFALGVVVVMTTLYDNMRWYDWLGRQAQGAALRPRWEKEDLALWFEGIGTRRARTFLRLRHCTG